MRTSSKLNVSLLVLILLVLSGIWWELHFHLHPCCKGDEVVLVRPEPIIVNPHESLVREPVSISEPKTVILFGAAVIILIIINRRIKNEASKRKTKAMDV